MLFERPRDALARLLEEYGAYSLKSLPSHIVKRPEEGFLQQMAVGVLLGKGFVDLSVKRRGRVVVADGPFIFLGGAGVPEAVSDAALVDVCEGSGCLSAQDLKQLLDEKPNIVIDLSLWHTHSEKEKKRVVLQIMHSVHVIRKYLWDARLHVTSVCEEARHMIVKALSGVCRIDLTNKNTLELLEELGAKRAILLDPNAEKELTEEEVKEADAFIIGGIVDLGRSFKGATSIIGEKYGLDSRVIRLRGSIVGVPDRINKILEILMLVRYEGLSIEEAIRATQTKPDRVRRCMLELVRRALRVRVGKTTRLIVPEHVREELWWLGVSDRELRIAARKSGVSVVSDECYRALLRRYGVVLRKGRQYVIVDGCIPEECISYFAPN